MTEEPAGRAHAGAEAGAKAQAEGTGGAGEWLAARRTGVPEPFGRRVRDAVNADGPIVAQAALVTSAIAQLREALDLGHERAAATPLLVADALLTYAVEAAAASNASLDALAADITRQLTGLIAE